MKSENTLAFESLPASVRLGSEWAIPPQLKELILLTLLTGIVFAVPVSILKSYPAALADFGDSGAYISIASAIQHWDFRGLQIKQFWGYPYAMAAVSLVTRLSDQSSLLLVSFTCSLASVVLAYWLWGGWIAGLFAVLNFDWMQRSFLGGSEPLAVTLIFGALVAIRKNRYAVAAFLAALSTVVRPLGLCCLVAIGIVLLYRREYKKLASSVLIGVAVGALYVLPLAIHFGDPLATVHSYGNSSYPLFGIPFYAIVKGTILFPAPWTNLALDFGWIAVVLAGVIAMRSLRPRNPETLAPASHPDGSCCRGGLTVSQSFLAVFIVFRIE